MTKSVKVLRDTIQNNGDQTPWGMVTELRKNKNGIWTCRIGGRMARAEKKSPYFRLSVPTEMMPTDILQDYIPQGGDK